MIIRTWEYCNINWMDIKIKRIIVTTEFDSEDNIIGIKTVNVGDTSFEKNIIIKIL